MTGCTCGGDFIAAERRALKCVIAMERERLRRTVGYDVGYKAAERAFGAKRLSRFAQRFHHDYCRRRCEERGKCHVRAA